MIDGVGLKSLEYKDLQSLNGGLTLLSPWAPLFKFALALGVAVAEQWEEYQEAYKEGYEDARNNGY